MSSERELPKKLKKNKSKTDRYTEKQNQQFNTEKRIKSPVKNEDEVSKLEEVDLLTVMSTMVNRQQFKYTACLILKYLFTFMWCRNLGNNRQNKNIKPHFKFEKSEEKLNKELDVLNLMRQSRMTKLLTQILLNQK